jgi:hypothetical protein
MDEGFAKLTHDSCHLESNGSKPLRSEVSLSHCPDLLFEA